jgi:2-C-methyl-D-erythritol 4-phosphate cytidylyltransferase
MRSAIIVAGGTGTRMGASVPKQFLEVLDKPILVHTIEAYLRFDPELLIVLVLPEEHKRLWEPLHSKFFADKKITTTTGGSQRFYSVRNGLALLPDQGYVAIHDAVRPCISDDIIRSSFYCAERNGSAITAISLKDSIRQVKNDRSVAMDRSEFRIIQTPQTFELSTLKKAYQQSYNEAFTDDASVFESYGEQIHLIEGDNKNIKVNTPENLGIATLFLNQMLNDRINP